MPAGAVCRNHADRVMSISRTLAALFGGPRLHLLPRTDEPENRRAPDPRWPALIGLLVTLLLVLGGVLLIHLLGRASRLQDCVMSGRTNCAPIDSGSVNSR
jgi:hypothetical protein